ncbi:MAG: hypothetical protein JXB24_12845 [Bacteroidales bacterium]|nr:hypothetical protein [Bacteroidales bacterium]
MSDLNNPADFAMKGSQPVERLRKEYPDIQRTNDLFYRNIAGHNPSAKRSQ